MGGSSLLDRSVISRGQRFEHGADRGVRVWRGAGFAARPGGRRRSGAPRLRSAGGGGQSRGERRRARPGGGGRGGGGCSPRSWVVRDLRGAGGC